jgi:kynureninase
MMMDVSGGIEQARELDGKDPLRSFRERFYIPQHNGQDSIYLCGNSLGLQPKKAGEYVDAELEDWANLGVEGHFRARHPWMPYHEFLTENMAGIVGARPIEVVVMNSLTVNIHLLFVTFYRPEGKKRKIVVESDIFPSDLYAVESQIRFHGGDPAQDLLFWEPPAEEHLLQYADLEQLVKASGDEIALIWLGGVNYYTGQSFDLQRITELGHAHGIPVGFDLAHGAGNIDYSLHDSGVDFAAWCSYKYLNSSPGGLSGIFVHERHSRRFDLPRFAGWWGHNKATRFGMRDPFDPLPGAEGWQLSNPPILPLAAMRASLEIFVDAGMQSLREKSTKLTTYLYTLIRHHIPRGIQILTSEHPDERGCQLSLLVPAGGREIFDILTRHGVVADWREPDVIRVAPVPLYNTYEDVWHVVKLLKNAIKETAG